jgi:hypothetical protein
VRDEVGTIELDDSIQEFNTWYATITKSIVVYPNPCMGRFVSTFKGAMGLPWMITMSCAKSMMFKLKNGMFIGHCYFYVTMGQTITSSSVATSSNRYRNNTIILSILNVIMTMAHVLLAFSLVTNFLKEFCTNY